MKIIFRCDPALRDRLPRPAPALQALPEWLREMPGADDKFAGVLRAGTPVAQCFPVSREAISLVFEELTPERIEAHDQVANALHAAPGVYRKVYRDKRPSSDK